MSVAAERRRVERLMRWGWVLKVLRLTVNTPDGSGLNGYLKSAEWWADAGRAEDAWRAKAKYDKLLEMTGMTPKE